MQEYTDYQYLFPPRPETKVAKPMLGFYQNKGFVAQKKKNGTCTVVFARGNEVIFKTRHNDDHKLWRPQADHIDFFRGSEGWNVFVGELLHSKVSGGPRDELYIFDQLVGNGKVLYGTSFSDRIKSMKEKFGGVSEDDQYRIADRITLAKSFKSGFVKLFDNLKKEDEGLVLKDPNALLLPCLKPDANRGWQVKCRIAAANYSF
jgi:hypothetical protein